MKRWCGPHVGRAGRHWRRFRAPARCRPEVGVPSGSRDFCAWGIRGLLPSGQRADRRSAFQAVPAIFARGGFVVCCPPGSVPTGGRRSKRFPRFLRVWDSWFAALRAACRPEVGVPSGPRDFCACGIRGLLPSGQRAGRRPALHVPALFLRRGMRFRGLRPRGCRRSLLGPPCSGYAGFLSRKSFQARARRVFSPWLTSAVTTWRASEGSVMSGTPRSTARRRTR